MLQPICSVASGVNKCNMYVRGHTDDQTQHALNENTETPVEAPCENKEIKK